MRTHKLFEGLRGEVILLISGPVLRYKSITAVTKKIGCTYAYGTKIISELRDHKMVILKKVGRRNELRLTKKGQEVANCIIQYKAGLKKAQALY